MLSLVIKQNQAFLLCFFDHGGLNNMDVTLVNFLKLETFNLH